jgi:cell division inhibitor SulA
VIEREIPGASKMSEEQIRAASLKSLEVLRQLGPEIRWLRSFVTDDKIFCIYFAPDEAMIREHGRLAGIPVDRVTAVRRMLDPAAFQA